MPLVPAHAGNLHRKPHQPMTVPADAAQRGQAGCRPRRMPQPCDREGSCPRCRDGWPENDAAVKRARVNLNARAGRSPSLDEARCRRSPGTARRQLALTLELSGHINREAIDWSA